MRIVQLALEHVGGLLGRRADDLRLRLARLVERAGSPPPPATSTRCTPSSGSSIQAASHCACSVVALPISRTTTTRAAVMNGGLCSAVVSAANAGSSVEPSEPRASSSSSALSGRTVAGTPPARHRVVVECERTILAAEQLVDEALHLAVAQARIGTLDENDAHSNASIVRHTRAVPRTSCTRTIRQPCMTPYATAASDSGRRSSISRRAARR